jgi:hypothetical protein
MWVMLPSLQPIVQELAPVFTQPSFVTHWQLLLGWLMCLGARTEFRVAQSFHADEGPWGLAGAGGAGLRGDASGCCGLTCWETGR